MKKVLDVLTNKELHKFLVEINGHLESPDSIIFRDDSSGNISPELVALTRHSEMRGHIVGILRNVKEEMENEVTFRFIANVIN